jgi:hypothetical protein
MEYFASAALLDSKYKLMTQTSLFICSRVWSTWSTLGDPPPVFLRFHLKNKIRKNTIKPLLSGTPSTPN